ncbi:MAG: DUF262 domain-containing protein [Paludibacteraceae bacterium]|nr:DUF262 domain-containing protein [Paludibacteraceae bacterium]
MKTILRTDITVADICKGFYFDVNEGKGLYGLSGKLTIQPEYQRNYLYSEKGGKMEKDVIYSVLKGYPLGVIYFNQTGPDKYEILDGQQRVTSLGRFVTGKFPIIDENGLPQYYDGLNAEQRKLFDESQLLIYICEGEEAEIKEWFKTINIVGIPLKDQEILNAIYSGPFVTALKEQYSNSQSPLVQKWSHYISGAANRQDYLATALKWVSGGNIEEYMSKHRYESNISEVKNHFDSVLDWVSAVFTDIESEMKGLEWGRLYDTYHKQAYNPAEVSKRVHELYQDFYVKDKKGIFEYILGGEQDKRLLEVRIFDEPTKLTVYKRQTAAATEKGESNCPLCALGNDNNRNRLYKFAEMDADHVAAWSKGGETTIDNCQMLCKTHNRAKGNK